MEAHTDIKMNEEDTIEKRIANESIGQFWRYMGYQKKPYGDDEEDQTNKSKNVQPRSYPKNSQGNNTQRKNHQTRYEKIPKGRKNQFELLQFIRYNPLFENGVGNFSKDSEAVKLDVEIVDTEEVKSFKDSAVITRLTTAASAPVSSDTRPFPRPQKTTDYLESVPIEPTVSRVTPKNSDFSDFSYRK